jgi:hypothetical protein
VLLDSDDEDENMNENQNEECSKDSGSGSSKSKKGTNSRKRKKRPGTRISGFRLVVNCPQHSGQILAPRRSSEAESNADIHPQKKRRTFAGKDINSWLSLKHQVDKSAYIQPVGMSLGGPRTLRNSGSQSHCAVPSMFDSKCIKVEDDVVQSISDDEMVPGFLDLTAPVRETTTAEGRNILSTAENFANMSKTWKKSVIPGKSAIHGWGAFATRKFAKDEMVIEYVGELVRPSVAEIRERRLYDKLVGAGTYVFRLNTSYCVDATRSGNLAHLLNHSCNPNCVSRTISGVSLHCFDIGSTLIFHSLNIIFIFQNYSYGPRERQTCRPCGNICTQRYSTWGRVDVRLQILRRRGASLQLRNCDMQENGKPEGARQNSSSSFKRTETIYLSIASSLGTG